MYMAVCKQVGVATLLVLPQCKIECYATRERDRILQKDKNTDHTKQEAELIIQLTVSHQ